MAGFLNAYYICEYFLLFNYQDLLLAYRLSKLKYSGKNILVQRYSF